MPRFLIYRYLMSFELSLMLLTCSINEFPALGSFSNTLRMFFLYLLLSSFSWPRFESCSWVRILTNVLVKYSASWNWIFCSLGLVFNSLVEQLKSNSSNMLVTRCSLLKLSESVISRNNCVIKTLKPSISLLYFWISHIVLKSSEVPILSNGVVT